MKVKKGMAAKTKSGLGRGLDSIFLDNTAPEGSGGGTMVRISQIEPRKDQPRKNFELEALQQLADSIATHGLIQPVVVRESIGGYYEIIAGERRWRAAKMAKSPVPVATSNIRRGLHDFNALIALFRQYLSTPNDNV